MALTPQQAYFIDLLSPDRPHPGHGLRIDAFGSRYADVDVVLHGDIEDRAQLGKRQLQLDLESLEVIADDRVPQLHLWTGTEVFAAAFGSEVHRPAGDMPFALPAVATAAEADRLPVPDIGTGSLGEMFALGDRLVELCGPGYPVRICDVQSPLDIAALIWEKSALFVALHEQPEAVHRLLRKITDTLTAFVHAFLRRYDEACLVHFPPLWMPASWGICLSEDEIGSLSPEMFHEFGLPYLRELAAEFGGISLHCCATAQHQWDELASLPGMRYLNLFHPATDLQASIDQFSGHAVLVPTRDLGPLDLDFVDACLERARPDTRFFFRTEAEGLEEAAALAAGIRGRCGRVPTLVH